MVTLDLTLMHSNTLVASVRPAPSRDRSAAGVIAARRSPCSELAHVLRCDAVQNLLVVLAGDYSLETLHEVASWFPRRLNGGRVAVASASHVKGRAFASTLTVPLLPRPVRVFPLEQAERALRWVANEEPPVDVTTDIDWSSLAQSALPPLNLSFLPSPDTVHAS